MNKQCLGAKESVVTCESSEPRVNLVKLACLLFLPVLSEVAGISVVVGSDDGKPD